MSDKEENLVPTQDAEGEAIHYEFDETFQEGILSLALRDSSFLRRSVHLLKPEHFSTEAYATVCQIALNFYKKYHTAIDRTALKQVCKEAIEAKIIRDEVRPEVLGLMKQIYSEGIPSKETFEGHLADWARKQAVTNAIYKSVSFLEKGDYSRIEQSIKKALNIGIEESGQDYDYYKEIENRTALRKSVEAGEVVERGITTGVFALDGRLYHKGWGRKELSIIMGGAKAGKSMSLLYFARKASEKGFRVLYVTLEVSGDIIAERLDACVANVAIRDLGSSLREVDSKVAEAGTKSGQLMIKEYPSGTLNPGTLRKLLEDYRNNRGMTFDLICLDYADLMRPDVMTRDNPIENSRNIYVDLRAIAFDFDCAMLTATQTNREGMKSKVAKMEHVSDDINKVRTADLLISINATDEEKANNEAVLYFAASRNQEGNFSIRVKQDMGKAQFITSVIGVE